MAERTKATVSKTVESLMGFRGFESHSLRGEKPSYSLDFLALVREQFALPAGWGEQAVGLFGKGVPLARIGGMAERTKATVLKTVEVIPPWVRIPLPPLSEKPCYAGLFAACVYIGNTVAAPSGARSGRDRGAGESLEPCSGSVWRCVVAAT